MQGSYKFDEEYLILVSWKCSVKTYVFILDRWREYTEQCCHLQIWRVKRALGTLILDHLYFAILSSDHVPKNLFNICMIEERAVTFSVYEQSNVLRTPCTVWGFNLLTPNNDYSGCTATLISKCCITYIYSTNTGTEYFKHGMYSPFFPLQNAVCFIILTYLVPVLFTFYIQSVLKLKK